MQNIASRNLDPRPVSAVSHAVGLCGLAGLFVCILVARNFGLLAEFFGFSGLPERADGPYMALGAVACCGAPMLIWSVLVDKVHRRSSTGIDWSLRRPVADVLDTSILKIAGLWATWALIASVYVVFRFWWTDQFANFPFAMDMFQIAVIPLVILSVPYVIWLDCNLTEPRDGSWHLGALLAGRHDWDKGEIFHHLRAWGVKGFFLSFMIAIVPGGFQSIVMMDTATMLQDPVALVNALITIMFMVDVQFATIGYLVTMKPFDAHIRTANPYLGGWIAALICYPPLILMGNGGLLDYHVAAGDWVRWLGPHTKLLYVWGVMLVILTAIYAWSTMAFGVRFSNLTNRGILTHGPYSWTRHPAYLSKNIYWWLAGLPFLVTNGNPVDAARNTALLACVSGVYYWRAKTEEKHLLADPAYVAYSAWMDRRAPVPRIFAWMKSFLDGRMRSGAAIIHPAE